MKSSSVLIFFIIVCLTTTSQSIWAQTKKSRKESKRELRLDRKEKESYSEKNQEREGEEDENEEYDGPDKAAALEFQRTKDPALGYVPRERLIRAIERVRQSKSRVFWQRPSATANRTSAVLTWSERGPNTDVVGSSNGNTRANSGVTAGRVRAVMVDSADATKRTVWVGGVDGGLWKTTDITASPANWILVNDFLSNLAVTDICQNPRGNGDTMYFCTGEAFYNSDAVRGNGVFKSVDHGVTWTQLSSTSSYTYCTRILCDYLGNVYLATRDNGLLRSTNGGATWTTITPNGLVSTRICDLKISSTSGPARLHMVAGIFSTQTYRYTDIPATVTSSVGWNSPVKPFPSYSQRAEIACRGNLLYALPVTAAYSVDTIYKSTDGGVNWNKTSGQPASGWSSTQCWYNLAVDINPANTDEVIIGALDNYKTTNGGATWTKISNWVGTTGQYVHADIHRIVWYDGGNKLIFACDGGIHYSSDRGTTIRDRNVGLRIKQFYSCAINPTSTNFFLAGAQDNGVHLLNGSGLTGSTEVTGGDGAFVAIDQNQPAYQFGSYVYNTYRRSTNTGTSWSSCNFYKGTIISSSNFGTFINPFDYDNTNNAIYSGADGGEYFRWTNPQTLAAGSYYASTGFPAGARIVSGITAFNSSKVSAVFVSPYTSKRVYFGTEGGRVVYINNADTATLASSGVNITGAGMPSGTVSCVNTGSSDRHLIVSYSNYGVSNVWISYNGGTSWTAVDGNLPDMPVRWCMFWPGDSTRAIIATEAGVMITDTLNGVSTTWNASPTFPTVRTDMLKYRSSDNTLLAATHGRGLWTTTVPTCTAPIISASSNSPICVGQTLNLTGTSDQPSATYSWVGPNAFTSTSLSPSITNVTAAASGTYTLSASFNGCVGSTSVVVTINSGAPPLTSGATVCQGASGSLTSSTNCSGYVNSGTTCSGSWNAITDSSVFRPNTMTNSTTCSFSTSVKSNYSAINFQVNVSGTYTFEMNASTAYDGMAYIVTGNFIPGNCSGGGTWIVGDDDGSAADNEPLMTASLTAGITYTLISTTYFGSTATYTGSYAWTITPPSGGQIMLFSSGAINWFTASSGGTSIGSGSPFNPVGVAGSGLANTNTAGTTVYYAECSNNAGCRTATNYVINANPIAPSVTVTQPTCTVSTGTITVTSSLTGLNFSTDGSTYTNTTGVLSGLSSGSYNVTARNASGCVSSAAAATVNTQPSTPTVPSVTVTQPTCTVSTGTITVTSSLTGLNFSTDGSTYTNTTGVFSGLSSGSYNVTARNASGCVSSAAAATVNTQPSTPIAPSVSVTQPTCTVSTGTITVTSSLTGLTFSTDGTTYTNTTGVFSGLSSGSYNVTARNASGCVSSAAAATVNTQPSTPTAPSVSVTQPTCTVSTGTITVTSSLTGLNFSTDGSTYTNTTGVFSGLSSGSYNVTARNASGCVSSATAATVNTQPSTPIAPSVSVTQPTCTVSTGTITVTSSLTGLTFSTDGTTYTNTTGVFSGLSSGSYNVTARNASGCVSSATAATVNTQPSTPIAPSVSATQPTCTVSTGTITVTSSLTGLNFSTDGSTYTNTTGVFSGLSSGSYNVTARNASGCVSNATAATVNAQPFRPMAPQASDTQRCGTGTLVLLASVPSGTTVDWYDNSTAGPLLLGGSTLFNTPSLSATTTYYAEARSVSSGCLSTSRTAVRAIIAPVLSKPIISANGPLNFCSGDSVILTSSSAIRNLWNTGDTVTSIKVSTTGSYILRLKNVNGCLSDGDTVEVSVNSCPAGLNVKLFLQGYYLGGGYMNARLLNAGITGNQSLSDSIIIELHDPTAPFAIASSQRVIVGTNGNASASFPGISGNYYIVIRHPSALETWSAMPVNMTFNTSYDFTDAISKAYGSNQADLGGGAFGLYSGDLNQDGMIESKDYFQLHNSILVGLFGYYPTDINGDGAVDFYDNILMESNVLKILFVQRPL